jgi:hypothetical protein
LIGKISNSQLHIEIAIDPPDVECQVGQRDAGDRRTVGVLAMSSNSELKS